MTSILMKDRKGLFPGSAVVRTHTRGPGRGSKISQGTQLGQINK